MDPFSKLPDEILPHILSFLTTKEAALTSILSKRWRNLLAFVPVIDIDDLAFVYSVAGARNRKRDEILQSFVDFMDRLLALQGDFPIKKFSLKCKSGIDSDRMNRWICNVLKRGVSDLRLFVGGDCYDYYLSHEVFVKRTHWWPGAHCIFSPMLKTLVIDPSWILSDKVELLLQSFPVLEELDLSTFHWKGSGETVSSATLKKLIIYASGCLGVSNPKSISFDAPSLLYFEYSDFVAEDYPKVNLPNVVEARLRLMLHHEQINRIRGIHNDAVGDVHPCGNAWKLMRAVRNVEKLTLSNSILEVLSLCIESMPVFENLKWLKIKSRNLFGWQAMPVLIKNCPHLETLILEGLLHHVTDNCGDACDCITREEKGRSLISCPVKKLQIKGFRGTKREMEMIKHFLESFPCLKRMEIYAKEEENGDDDPTDLDVPEKLELVVKKVNLYNELTSCDVSFVQKKNKSCS